ncbi:MAG: endonuclease/exonuclease/phosphatase family protein [Patescibacteria group bacterium]
MPVFSLLTVNIEGDNHLNEIEIFVREKQPDVLCVQEIFSEDVALFQKVLGVRAYFAPMCRVEHENPFRLSARGEWGVAIFSRLPIESISVLAYEGELNHIPIYDNDNPNSVNRVLLVAKIKTGMNSFFVATTHFTWTNHGEVTPLQHQHLDAMFELLHEHNPLVLCGDFNAPRGKSVFARLASKYKDNIPADITTTIDQHLHRTQGIQFVVDGVFTTPELKVEKIEVIDGVSDHQAIFAAIASP